MIRKPEIYTTPPSLSRYKIILSGRIVEACRYAKPVGYNLQSDKKERSHRHRRPLKDQQITRTSLSRTKNRLIRLINANAFMWKIDNKVIKPLFITFTFKDNVQDLDVANSFFTNYIKRLNYQIFKSYRSVARYVVVPEFQKRGAVHYHAVFFNLPKVDLHKEFKKGRHRKIWGKGFIKIKPIMDMFNTGLYMTKYLSKDLQDRRLVGRKKFFASRGLHQPEIITQEHVATNILEYLSALDPIHRYKLEEFPDPRNPEKTLPMDNPTWHATYSLMKKQHEEVLKLTQKWS